MGVARLCRRRAAALVATASVIAVLAACSGTPDQGSARSVSQASLVAAIDRQLGLFPSHDRLRSILVSVDGQRVVEKYFSATPDPYSDVESVTASILSSLIGIALHEGHIGSLDESLADLLPDHRAEMGPVTARTTLRELLTMTGGFPVPTSEQMFAAMSGPDPVGAILRSADPSPNQGFQYSPPTAHLLAAVLAESTGMSVLDYARSRLFDPLGIDTSEPGFDWPADSTGLNFGWSHLRLRPTDLERIGQLYLHGGEWRGRQVVPASWVMLSTRPQVVGDQTFPGYGLGYGLGWWVASADNQPAYFAWGSGGQLIEVVPSYALVVVATTDAGPTGREQGGFTPNTLTFLVDDVIAPAVAQ